MKRGKIQVLPETVSQKIAAGEVVERPASVVKELMENAIDAGATEIVVELQSGGLQSIRVADNGEGMVSEDVPLSLQRFATSKIREAEDLYAIETLGFRGEALPSIAAVSKLVLTTRHSNSISGTKVVSEGGEIKYLSETGSPVGTEVEVRDLFYNLPVRRRFLRSIRTELRYALQQFLRVGLAYPSITFKLIHDGRTLEELWRTDSPLVRIEAVLGKGVSHHLESIQQEENGIRVEGFVSLPSLSKGNGEGISLYVNRRYVKDRVIYKALLDAYQHILPAHRYPIAVLYLFLLPSSVDVNVHPTKAEVKFKEPERVYQTVWSCVRRVLEEVRPEEKDGSTHVGSPPLSKEELQPQLLFQKSPKPTFNRWKVEDVALKVEEGEKVSWEAEKQRPYRILGQIWGTYILCEAEEKLIFVDQHAAHERVLYERLKKRLDEKALVSEKLLLPLLIELSPEESLILDSTKDAFEAVGFEIEPMGKKLYAIRSLPPFVEPKEADQTVREMLEELSSFRKEGQEPEVLHALLISLACHSAVRANFPLRREEMEVLIGDLYPFNPSTTCPHGRPIYFFQSLDEMNRRFKRD